MTNPPYKCLTIEGEHVGVDGKSPAWAGVNRKMINGSLEK